MDQFIHKLKDLVAQAEGQSEKFWDKGVKSAGTSLRNTMQEIKETAQEERQAVLMAKKQPKDGR